MVSDGISASGIPASTVTNIEVDITASHTWVGDLVIKLQAPDGTILGLMSRPGFSEPGDDGTGCCGTNAPWSSTTVTWSDGGGNDAETFTGAETSVFPNPGMITTPPSTFTELYTGLMNGTWTLYVGDAGPGDFGTLIDWEIRISVLPPGCVSGVGCQLPNYTGYSSGGTLAATSDENPNANFIVQDNFKAASSGNVTSVCWWGGYFDFNLFSECNPGPGDDFTITYYSDLYTSGVCSPGSVIGGPFSVTPTKTATGNPILSGVLDNEYIFEATHAPVAVSAGQTYWIEIKNNTASGDCFWLWSVGDPDDEIAYQNGGAVDYDLAFCVDISLLANACLLPNDLCSGAEEITLACGDGVTVSGTTVGATFDNVGTCGTSNTAPGVWYTFTGTGNDVTVTTCDQANYDTKLSVFSGSCGSLTCVGGNDDGSGCSGFTSELTVSTTSGTTYYILVHGFSSGTGDFDLSLSDGPDLTDPTIINCPADVNQDADAGLCNAAVTVAVPVFGVDFDDNCSATIINDFNGTNDASDTYPVGVTTVTWTATDGNGNTATCVQTITISDTEGPALTCPSDINQGTDPGQCDAVVTYTAPVGVDNCEPVNLTQSVDQATITAFNSVSCNDGIGHTDNSYFRVYDLPALGYTNDFFVHSVDVAIEEASSGSGTQTIDVNIYSFTGALVFASLTNLVASETVTVADQSGTIINVPIVGTIPAGTKLAVEVFTPNGQIDGNLFFIGSNPNGQTGTSYLAAADCGIPEPTSVATIGFPGMHIMLDVNAGSFTELTAGLGSGATFPVGTTTEEYTSTDLYGNTTVCSFDVTITDDENPVIDCTTAPPLCITTPNDGSALPLPIPDDGTTTNDIVVSGFTGTITDVNILGLQATHSWVGDLDISLTSPDGTTISLMEDLCDNGPDDLDINFDDAGAAYGTIPCPPTDAGTYQPLTALSAFAGENPNGTWTLTITDDTGFDTGTLDNWSIEICTGGDNTVFASADPGVCEAALTIPQPTFSDNCPGAVISNDYNNTNDASDTYPVGTTTVLWTAVDLEGNSATCTMEVTVTDDEFPVITCPGDIILDNDPGQCGAVVSYADPTFSDNCPIPPVAGFTGGQITIPDGDPAGTTGNQTVSVLGTSLGTDVFLQSICIEATHTWVGDLEIVLVSPNGDPIELMNQPPCTGDNLDVCFVPGTGNPLAGGTCTNLPAYSGNFTASGGDLGALSAGTDPNGVWTLFVADHVAFDAGQIDSWTLNFLDVGGTPSATQTAGLPSGSTFPVGTTTNTFEITDGSGNTSTCSFDVVISDVEAPVLNCPDVTVDNDPGLCEAVVNYAVPEGIDNCDPLVLAHSNSQDIVEGAGISCSAHPTFTFYNRLATNFDMSALGYPDAVHLTGVQFGIDEAVAGSGGVQPATVNIYTLSGPMSTANLSLLATQPITIADQNNTIQTVPMDLLIPSGANLVFELEIPDGSSAGNYFTIGTNFSGQNTPSYILSADCGALDFADIEDFEIDQVYVMNLMFGTLTEFVSGIGTGGTFPVGTTTETYQATDVYGNISTCSFDVIVNDVEIPTIDCGAPDPLSCVTTASTDVPLALPDAGTITTDIVVSGVTGPVTDVNILGLDVTHSWVGDLDVTLTSPDGTTIVLFQDLCDDGTENLLLDFDDAGSAHGSIPCPPTDGQAYQPSQALSAFNGENGNGTWTLSITDDTGLDSGTLNGWSIEVCTGGTGGNFTYTSTNDPGDCGAIVTIAPPTAADNCPLVLVNDYNNTDDATDFYPVGTTTVTWTVTDPSGNSASCQVDVVVTDDEFPVIDCPGDIFVDNDPGQCGAVVSFSTPTISDNCPIPSVVQFTGGSFSIPDGDAGGVTATQTIGVTGTNLGTDVMLQSVCIEATHSWVGDLEIVLISPNGDPIELMNQPSCTGDNLDVCFVPGTGSPISAGSCGNLPAYSGQFTAEGGDLGSLSVGTDPNGVWTLFVADHVGFDVGQIDNWTLNFLDLGGVPAPIQIAGLPSGSDFPVGTTTNTFEITDASGNTSTCSFDVVVSDVEGPTFADCSADIEVDNDPGVCGAVVTYTIPVGVDNCDPFLITHSLSQAVPAAAGIACNTGGLVNANRLARVFDVDAFGFSGGLHVTGVSFGIDDASAGSGGTQPATVNLYSLTGPMSIANLTLLATQPITIPDQTGTIMTVPMDLNVAGGTQLVFEINIPDGVSAGNTLFIGANGAGQTGPSWIQSSPCGATNYADLAGLGAPNSHFVMNVLAGANTVQTDGTGFTSGDEFPVGTTNQEYTSTDIYGNQSVCSFNVIVNDVEDPVITCPGDMIACDGDVVTYTVTTSDNCPGETVQQTAGLPSGSVFPLGITTNTFVVTDASGNTATCSFDVNVTPVPVADFTFFPTCIGEIIYFTSTSTVDPSGGTSIVSHQWQFNDGSGVNTDVNPTHVYNTAGDYDVTLVVTTNWGCTDTVTYTVSVQPTPEFTTDVADVLCFGQSNGSITVNITVGNSPVSYSINGGPGQSSNIFSGLAAGTYLISITTVDGCEASASVTVDQPAQLVASEVSTTPALCFGQASGAVEVTATGGTTPYSYSVDGGASQASGVFTGLTGGVHVFTVTDDNGCTATVSVTVGQPDQIVVDASSSPVLCNGDATGSITVTATGGTTPYQYSVDGGANYQASGTFTDLPAGSYVVVVEDDNGCSVSEGVIITEPAQALSATADVQNVACTGDDSGVITVTASGGIGARTYSLDGGTTTQSGNVFSGLAAGDYTVTVTDANGCTATVDVTVAEPAQLLTSTVDVTPVSCNGEGDGMIDVTATGGDAPYEYSFNAGVTWQSSSTFTDLAPGTYTVLVRDANGCEVATIVVMTQPAPLTVAETASSDASCEGASDGSFTVAAAGGTSPYTYTLNGNSNTDGVFGSVTSGDNLVTVTDASGCETSITVEVGHTNPLPDAAFNWFASGTVVQFSNQTTNGTSYSWDFGDGSTSTDASPIHTYASGGTYTVTLIATNACGSDTITWVIDTNNIGIDNPDGDAYILNVYPNPNHGQFTLTYTGTGIIGDIQVNIMTIEGKMLMAEQFTVNADTFVRNYSDIELAGGIYIVQFVSENGSEIKRIIVDK